MSEKMKTIIFEKYGAPEVLHPSVAEKPSPRENEVLIKVHATSVTKYDCWVRSCTSPPGFNFIFRLFSGKSPKYPILGTELAGEVEAVGENVSTIQAGDRVFAFTGMELGAYAEYICLPEESVTLKPRNIGYEESAGILQGALTAYYFLRRSNIQPGKKVLIFGASGGVGSYAVQIAKHFYHAEVTGVCSTSKMAFVQSIGADHVIDYTREDFTKNGQKYDVIFDTVGKTSIPRTKKTINSEGWYLFATFSLFMFLQIIWLKLKKNNNINIDFGALEETNQDLVVVQKMVEAGAVTPRLDRCFPLEEAAQAHRYVESGQKMGNVILRI